MRLLVVGLLNIVDFDVGLLVLIYAGNTVLFCSIMFKIYKTIHRWRHKINGVENGVCFASKRSVKKKRNFRTYIQNFQKGQFSIRLYDDSSPKFV